MQGLVEPLATALHENELNMATVLGSYPRRTCSSAARSTRRMKQKATATATPPPLPGAASLACLLDALPIALPARLEELSKSHGEHCERCTDEIGSELRERLTEHADGLK